METGLDGVAYTASLPGGRNPWLGGRMPYRISNTMDNEMSLKIEEAIAYWNRTVGSHLLITPHEQEECYVLFTPDPMNCSSHVGRSCLREMQEIKLAPWAKVGNVLRELGHAAGLLHVMTYPETVRANAGEIGQRESLSDGDIVAIKLAYPSQQTRYHPISSHNKRNPLIITLSASVMAVLAGTLYYQWTKSQE